MTFLSAPSAESDPNNVPDLMRFEFGGCEQDSDVFASGRLPGKSNYFIGNDPNRWHADVPHYKQVDIPDICPGIAVSYRGKGSNVEYDLTVAPGADSGQARIDISGTRRVELNAAGELVAFFFTRLSSAAEVSVTKGPVSAAPMRRFLGIGHSRSVVLKLSSLFALDSFGGAFVVQSFAAYWFYLRFGVNPATLGAIFFGANVFVGISALLASRLASRFGLVKTMVFTHLPSNVLLILVPLMPTLPLAISVLLLRFSISQMDVPARQSYIMAVVRPEERSAAAGITGVARTIGASIAPVFVGLMFARPSLINLPFFVAGVLKIAYDLLLYRGFVTVRPPEETA